MDIEVEEEAGVKFSLLASDSDLLSLGNGAEEDVWFCLSSDDIPWSSCKNCEFRMNNPRSPTNSPRATFSSRSVCNIRRNFISIFLKVGREVGF